MSKPPKEPIKKIVVRQSEWLALVAENEALKAEIKRLSAKDGK